MLKINDQLCKNVPLARGRVWRYEPSERYDARKIEISLDFDNAACIYRDCACFTAVRIIEKDGFVPEETQYILMKKGDEYTLIYSLCDGAVRTCISLSNGKLFAILDTGIVGKNLGGDVDFIYTVSGSDPYELFAVASAELSKRYEGLMLLKDKTPPVLNGYFGFCTYNAFYDKYNEEKVEKLLTLFEEHGQKLGFLLFDVGWQTTEGCHMTGFDADAQKFPSGLASFIPYIKEKYGLKYLLLWHTFMGYWAGINKFGGKYAEKCFPFDFDDKYKSAIGSEEINTANGYFFPCNLLGEELRFADEKIDEFYDDFYRYVSTCGADGTKIDAIGWAELAGQYEKGRIDMNKRYVRAISDKGQKYFGGKLITCSCNHNDFLFNSRECNTTRSSTDYLPLEFDTHGKHILNNAHNVLWLGEFLNCDFDMFQTGGFGGEFHAKNRVISGGPVYVADELEIVNFDIISKMATKDGRIGAMDTYPRLTRDCLFVDPVKEKKLLAQFNRRGDSFVLGLYNCNVDGTVIENVSLSVIEGLPQGRYAAYSSDRGFLGVFCERDSIEVELSQISAELVCLVPVKDGRAILGLKDKYVPFAFVEEKNGEIIPMEHGTLMTYTDADGYCELEI